MRTVVAAPGVAQDLVQTRDANAVAQRSVEGVSRRAVVAGDSSLRWRWALSANERQ